MMAVYAINLDSRLMQLFLNIIFFLINYGVDKQWHLYFIDLSTRMSILPSPMTDPH